MSRLLTIRCTSSAHGSLVLITCSHRRASPSWPSSCACGRAGWRETPELPEAWPSGLRKVNALPDQRERGPAWELAMDIGNLDRCLLTAYRIQQNWGGRLRVIITVTASPLLAFADTHCCSRYGTLLTYREKICSISPG